MIASEELRKRAVALKAQAATAPTPNIARHLEAAAAIYEQLAEEQDASFRKGQRSS